VTATWNATITGNHVSGASNWCIQVDRSGGGYLGGPAAGTLPSKNINITGNSCVGNKVRHDWPFNPEIMIGDQFSCPRAKNRTGCTGASWKPGTTALNVTVRGNDCNAGNPSGTCVGVGFGAEGIRISNNTMSGCATHGQQRRSIWIGGDSSTKDVLVWNNTKIRGASCAGAPPKGTRD